MAVKLELCLVYEKGVMKGENSACSTVWRLVDKLDNEMVAELVDPKDVWMAGQRDKKLVPRKDLVMAVMKVDRTDFYLVVYLVDK